MTVRVGKEVSSLENIPDILILMPLGHSSDIAPEKSILQVVSHFFILCVSILVLFKRIIIIINSLKSKSTNPIMFHDDHFQSNFHRILDLQLQDHILYFFTFILLNKEPPSLILSNSTGRSLILKCYVTLHIVGEEKEIIKWQQYFKGYINLPEICWKGTVTRHKQSRLLEGIKVMRTLHMN